jgi:hypothetical protein
MPQEQHTKIKILKWNLIPFIPPPCRISETGYSTWNPFITVYALTNPKLGWQRRSTAPVCAIVPTIYPLSPFTRLEQVSIRCNSC